jgi:integrase
VLDFAGCDPNPAKDRRLKLPRSESTIPDPPSESAVAAIVANAPPKWRLALRVLEQTGMRAGELAKLEWADVDQANSRGGAVRRQGWLSTRRTTFATAMPR